jgi:WXG100 family type VII secretion target
MAVIKVSAEDVQGTASNLAAGHQTLTETHTQLCSQVQALVDGGWQGAASNSFHESWQKYNAGANQMFSALADIHQGMTATANTYAETEAKLSQGWA